MKFEMSSSLSSPATEGEQKNVSALQARELVVLPKKRTAEETSKELLSLERAALDQEIKETHEKLAQKKNVERIENRDRISEIKIRLALLKDQLESAPANWESSQKKYEELSETRVQQANTFAGRIKDLFTQMGFESQQNKGQRHQLDEAKADVLFLEEKQKQLTAEIGSLEALLECDDLRQSIKNKLKEHYIQAESVSQERFEEPQKTVEQSLIRNGVFIVHTLTTMEELRHNENSPISKKASLEDDLDIALSLEPSLSTSSVSPGKKKELFQEGFGGLGIIIGGGEIQSASRGDVGSVPTGIGKRASLGERAPLSQIDEALNDKEGGYNEIIVDNPKIFGLFKSVRVEKDGSLVTISRVNDFKNQMDLARKKGLPQFVLTPERRMFEYLSISDTGKIEIGKEIHPEDVAKGNAGLSREDRKKLGEGVISRSLFKNASHHEEAKKIVADLA